MRIQSQSKCINWALSMCNWWLLKINHLLCGTSGYRSNFGDVLLSNQLVGLRPCSSVETPPTEKWSTKVDYDSSLLFDQRTTQRIKDPIKSFCFLSPLLKILKVCCCGGQSHRNVNKFWFLSVVQPKVEYWSTLWRIIIYSHNCIHLSHPVFNDFRNEGGYRVHHTSAELVPISATLLSVVGPYSCVLVAVVLQPQQRYSSVCLSYRRLPQVCRFLDAWYHQQYPAHLTLPPDYQSVIEIAFVTSEWPQWAQ